MTEFSNKLSEALDLIQCEIECANDLEFIGELCQLLRAYESMAFHKTSALVFRQNNQIASAIIQEGIIQDLVESLWENVDT